MEDVRRYNQHKAIRYITDRIIYHLIDNNEIIWKLLKYNSDDALMQPNLTKDEKVELIYKGGGLKADGFKVFRQAYVDDVELTDGSMIRVFLSNIIPESRIISDVAITVECLVHNKNIMVESDLPDITYENRLELLS